MSRARTSGADRARLGLRLLVGGAACFLAGAPVMVEGRDAIAAGSPLAWVLLAPLVAVPVALARHEALSRTVHVHDRHFDLLVLVSLVVLIAVTVTLLTRRVGWASTTLRLDMLMSPVWIAAVVIALFGLRPMFEQLPTLWLVGAIWPFPYTVVGAYVPFHRLGWVIAGWILAVAVAALHHTRWVGTIVTTLVAVSNVSALAIVAPPLAPLGLLVGPLTVLAVARVRRWPHVFHLAAQADGISPPPLAVLRGRRAAGLVIVLAALAAIVGQGSLARFRDPVPALLRHACPDVATWDLRRSTRIGGGPERAGGDWELLRCRYRIDDGAGPRDIAVDISEPVSSFELGAYPPPLTLRGRGRLDPVRRTFAVADGTGEVFVFSDPSLPTELTMASVDVGRSRDALRRVTVLVPDDRRPSVSFPKPNAKPLIETTRRFTVVVRTQEDQLARYAVTPKDVDLSKHLLATVVEAGTGG